MVSKELDEKIVSETKYLVELFLKTNESDKEISVRTGISSSTVGRRLSNKSYILRAYPQNGEEVYQKVMEMRKSNLQAAKILGGQKSALNNIPLKDKDGRFNGSIPKINLDAIYYEKEANKLEFILQLALTFRLKLPLLSSLFQVDEKDILENLLSISNPSTYDALTYLFYHDNYDQDLARDNFLIYYKDLLNAKNDKEKEFILYNQINDSNMKSVVVKIQNNQELNDNDYYMIFKYQLKFALSNEAITNMLRIDKDTYINKIYSITTNNEELKDRYTNLDEYYNNLNRDRLV